MVQTEQFKQLINEVEHAKAFTSKEEIENIILANPEVISKLEGDSPKRVIVVPGKIINLVV